MRGLENELERRTVTYTTWNLSAKKAEAKSWHPLTFTSDTAGPEEIQGIQVYFLILITVFVLTPIFIHAN